jgi:hypothetical protein
MMAEAVEPRGIRIPLANLSHLSGKPQLIRNTIPSMVSFLSRIFSAHVFFAAN